MSKVVKAVGNAVSGVVKAVGSIVGGVVKAIGSVVSSVINFVASPFMGLFGAPDVPTNDSESNSIKGVLVQKSGTNVSVPVIYGYRKVGGIITFAETGADNNKYLWVAYVLGEGPVEGLKELWINDIQVPEADIPKLNAGGVVTITNTANKLANRTTLQFWSGIRVNTPSSTNVGPVIAANVFKGAPNWTTDMNYNGLATVFVRYEWKESTTQAEADANPFSGNIPELKACLLGRRVASLVSGSPENYAYMAYGDGYTERYSTNPAEILLDYLRNRDYGKGLTNDDIDWDSFKTAAAKCNQEVQYTSAVRGPILTLNYVVDTGQTIFQNVKLLLQNFRAYLPYSRGRFVLKIEDAGNPEDILSGSAEIVAEFDKNNIQGDITYTAIERSSKYNQVVVRYVDPTNLWTEQSVVYPETESERYAFQQADGGRENKSEVTMAGITNYAIAKDMARLIFNKSRYQDSLSFVASSQALELEVGDNIYVNSNILAFGTDPNAGAIPWRVVSLKLNNDFTFSIGCVRNPDIIYPHVRVGEIDYKNALYVPKGSSPLKIDPNKTVGLQPPSFAPRSTETPVNPLDVPTATNPNATAGGGVGAPSGTGNATTNPNIAPTPAKNVTAPTETIDIRTSTSTVVGGNIYVTLEFYQPANPMYTGVYIWYKKDKASETTWQQLYVTDRITAGATLNARIGPLSKEPYVINTRITYSANEASKQVGTVRINPSDVTGTSENPTDVVSTVDAGWSLPIYTRTNPANASVGRATGYAILSAGSPQNPRQATFSFVQDITRTGLNGFIKGIKVFYKASASTYWKYTEAVAPVGYIEGASSIDVTITNLGPVNPSVQSYDFVVRYTYTDGKAATTQAYIKGAQVESVAGSYTHEIISSTGTKTFNELVTSSTVSVITEDSVPELVVDTRTMTIGLLQVKTDVEPVNVVRLYIEPPVVGNRPDWFGVRVYSRPVQLGANPAYTIQDFTPVGYSSTGNWSVPVKTEYDKPYEYVVVPLVDYAGVKTVSNYAWYGRGTVHNRQSDPTYPLSYNWLQSLNFVSTPTATALNTIQTTFPLVNPTASVLEWKRIQTSYKGDFSTDNHYKNWYYQLKVQVPTGSVFNELQIYRRSRDSFNAPSDGTQGVAKYYGIGRWEKMTVTTTTHTFVDGVATINLRGSIEFSEFDQYYQQAGFTPARTLYKATYPEAGNKPMIVVGQEDFLLVLKTSGTESAKGLLLPYINERGATVDGLAKLKPTEVTVSTYNAPDAGYGRRLTDARAPIAIAKITPTIQSNPLPTVTPAII